MIATETRPALRALSQLISPILLPRPNQTLPVIAGVAVLF